MTQRKIQSEQIELGDVIEGVGSSTDNAIVRFDGTTGGAVQNSTVSIDDTGTISWAGHTALVTPNASTDQFRIGFPSNLGAGLEFYKNTHATRPGEFSAIYGGNGAHFLYYDGANWHERFNLTSGGDLYVPGRYYAGGAEVATTTGTQTLTNKRIQPRLASMTTAGSITPLPGTYDQYHISAQASSLTIDAPSGGTAGEKVLFRIKDNGTARTLTWNAIYRPIGVTLPTTTVASKTMYVGMMYNSSDTKWDVIAVSVEA